MKLLSYLQKTNQITRRDFEEMVKMQVMQINGTVVESINQEISIGDTIKIALPNGQIYEHTISSFPAYRPKLILFYKPKGYVVSKSDPHNKTIFEILPPRRQESYYPIGRLDKDSTGLLLLTNDPKLVDQYENPKHQVHKTYEVQLDKPWQSKHTIKATKGQRVTEQGAIASDDEQAEFLTFLSIRPQQDAKKPTVIITLTEGKKRHIRRLLKALGYMVRDLKRIKIGKWTLGSLKPGKWRIEHKI